MRVKDTVKEENIRHKAIEMIVNEGLYGFGINKLAKAAGVSPATIYIYFNDKEHLIHTLSIEVGRALIEYSMRGFDPEMSFEEGLKVQWKNRTAFFLEYPKEMEFLEIIRYTEFYEKVAKMMKAAFGESMNQFMRNAIANKQLLALPFEVYWSLAFSPLYQLIKFHTQGQSYVNSNFELNDDIMMQSLKLVLKALKP